MNNEEKKQSESRGFAGLSSMVSDVDDVISRKPKPSDDSPIEPSQVLSSGGNPRPKPSAQPSGGNQRPKPSVPSQSSGSFSTVLWVGAALIVGLVGLANQSDKNGPSKSAYSSEKPSDSIAPISKSTIGQHQASSRPSESKPSFGRNQVLSTEELRYCLAEKIRLDSGESILNNYSDSDVNSFNNYVDDYNRRCGEFRYRQGTLESARRDVEPYRDQLQIEGRNRFVSSSVSASSKPVSKPVSVPPRTIPDVTVMAIQRRLNELGYNAGTPDGIFGNNTRRAILAFQQDQGLSPDGGPTEVLLTSLRLTELKTEGIVETEEKIHSSPTTISSKGISSIDAQERTSIENVCSFYERTEGPASYQRCISRQLEQLTRHEAKPNLSRVTSAEQRAIENVCGFYERTEGPASYYSCLSRQLEQLGRGSGKPDLSRVSLSERNAIENVCGLYERTEGPASYYSCLSSQLEQLTRGSGKPDLTRVSQSERNAIVNVCGLYERTEGPASYYSCLSRQLDQLTRGSGKPDLSRVSQSERNAIENVCGLYERTEGPASYYSCLSTQLLNLESG